MGRSEDAVAAINQQIARGKDLSGLQLANGQNLAELKEQTSKWRKYVDVLLRRLFTGSALAEEFDSATQRTMVLGGGEFVKEARWAVEAVNRGIAVLDSVLERLPLLESSNQPATARPAARLDGIVVFIVHGHDEARTREVADLLRKLGLGSRILREEPDQGQTVIEKFERHGNPAFAVVLLTADDIGRARMESGAGRPRARQNVILELGYFLARLGRPSVCALRDADVEVPSDLGGVLYKDLDSAGAWRVALAKELKAAGRPCGLRAVPRRGAPMSRSPRGDGLERGPRAVDRSHGPGVDDARVACGEDRRDESGTRAVVASRGDLVLAGGLVPAAQPA